MKQIYHSFFSWEDFQHGMYANHVCDESVLNKAVELLSDEIRFDDACDQVIRNWFIACEVNLTNVNSNRRSWLGQAACSLNCAATEKTTRIAWRKLNAKQKLRANLIATKHIKAYERRYIKVHPEMGEQMLF